MRKRSLLNFPLNNKYISLCHGRTNANDKKIFMGRTDYSLNEIGINQVKDVELDPEPDIILSSPLQRARETVDILIKSLKTSYTIENRLIEKFGGSIEGKSYDEIAESCRNAWNIWDNKSLEYIIQARFPNGECDQDVIQRIEGLFMELENNHQGKTILLVTHPGVIQAIRYLVGKTRDEIYLSPIPNCHIELI